MVSNRRNKKDTASTDKGRGKIIYTMRRNPAVTLKGNTIEKYFAPKSVAATGPMDTDGAGSHLEDLLGDKELTIHEETEADIPEPGRKPAQKVIQELFKFIP